MKTIFLFVLLSLCFFSCRDSFRERNEFFTDIERPKKYLNIDEAMIEKGTLRWKVVDLINDEDDLIQGPPEYALFITFKVKEAARADLGNAKPYLPFVPSPFHRKILQAWYPEPIKKLLDKKNTDSLKIFNGKRFFKKESKYRSCFYLIDHEGYILICSV